MSGSGSSCEVIVQEEREGCPCGGCLCELSKPVKGRRSWGRVEKGHERLVIYDGLMSGQIY